MDSKDMSDTNKAISAYVNHMVTDYLSKNPPKMASQYWVDKRIEVEIHAAIKFLFMVGAVVVVGNLTLLGLIVYSLL